MNDHYDYDVLVIGSGFGGSVSALRLTEKGYRVGVLESGARFEDEDFAKTSWDVRRFLFAPQLGCYGIQQITLLRNVLVLHGAGVGGGSLVYANTLYEPSESFFADRQWAGITDWQAELAPHFEQAKRMLGVVENPHLTPADEAMRTVAQEMGAGHTFHPTPVAVFFGKPGTEPGTTVEDPYFGGAGPARRTCVQCGGCMTGCRYNAKNTLTKNYLYLAEQAGTIVHPLTTVTTVRPLAAGGYAVDTVPTGPLTSRSRVGRTQRKQSQTFTADQVIFAAGALGTQRILHRMKRERRLPNLSRRLGVLTRTNSEAIVGAVAKGRGIDYSQGIAITSSFHPEPRTHIEPVRYGKGSNVMGLLQTALTDGGGRTPRWATWLKALARHPADAMRNLYLKGWSERAVIALVMQDIDNSLTVSLKGERLTSRQGHGAPNPTWIPVANRVVRRLAELIDGTANGAITEVANIPLTAHIIGGCAIGEGPDEGVIDAYQRVYGHPGLHVIDGSAISANLGVNPSLTITAQAERAVSFWPNRGERDPRPVLGSAYKSIEPVEPKRPVLR